MGMSYFSVDLSFIGNGNYDVESFADGINADRAARDFMFDGKMDEAGVAQGGVVETKDGKWYSYLFQDHGSVGRVPVLVPVEWKDGWPVFGDENGKAESVMKIPGVSSEEKNIVVSDEFYNGETRKVYSDKDAVVQSSEEPKKAVKNKENKAEKEIIEVLENSGFEEGTKGWTTQQPG